jgi:hypothetical protein
MPSSQGGSLGFKKCNQSFLSKIPSCTNKNFHVAMPLEQLSSLEDSFRDGNCKIPMYVNHIPTCHGDWTSKK